MPPRVTSLSRIMDVCAHGSVGSGVLEMEAPVPGVLYKFVRQP